ncbi:MAG: GGDEF domain-containing protein [Alphaproteobacteria bacterium]|nr:GGDEF domain-containing protein [Alphaproteobacteria bacterium]MDD9920392.1 GGDEF domain-containing protein [Alphaproteobacteria bacterium]
MKTAMIDKELGSWNQDSSQAKRQVALHNEVIRLQRMLQEQAAVIKDLQRRATEDGLTGLLNRRGFDSALEQTFSDFKRYGRRASLLVLDMDNFKSINDTLGHLAGDALLQHIAELLKHHTRDSDIIARPGGDEFCIILQENTAEDARRKARELEVIISATPCLYEGEQISTSVSIGACCFLEANEKADIIAKADARMYRRKASNRSLRVMV